MAKLEVNILYNGHQNRRYAKAFESVVNHAAFNILFGGDAQKWMADRGATKFPYNLVDITSRTNRQTIEAKFGSPFNYNFCNAAMITSIVDDFGEHTVLFNQNNCGQLIEFNGADNLIIPNNPKVYLPFLHDSLVRKLIGAVNLVGRGNFEDEKKAEKSGAGVLIGAGLILFWLAS